MTNCYYLLVAILAQWQRPVVYSEALNLLHWALRAVLYWRTATHQNGQQKYLHFVIVVLFAVSPAAAGAIRSK
jgi:hypothetical protein